MFLQKVFFELRLFHHVLYQDAHPTLLSLCKIIVTLHIQRFGETRPSQVRIFLLDLGERKQIMTVSRQSCERTFFVLLFLIQSFLIHSIKGLSELVNQAWENRTGLLLSSISTRCLAKNKKTTRRNIII